MSPIEPNHGTTRQRQDLLMASAPPEVVLRLGMDWQMAERLERRDDPWHQTRRVRPGKRVRGMLVELRPNRSLERGKRLAQLGLDLGDLNLHLEELAPGAQQAQE